MCWLHFLCNSDGEFHKRTTQHRRGSLHFASSAKWRPVGKKTQYYVVRPLQCNYPSIPRLHWRRSTCPSVHHNTTMGLIKQPGNLPCSDLYTHGCTFHMHTLNEKRMFEHDRRIRLASKFIRNLDSLRNSNAFGG